MTKIEVTKFMLGRSYTDQYYVRRQAQDPRLVGAPLIYVGPKATFSINMTTAPLPNGKRPATLVTQEALGEPIVTKLVCKFN
jgi:hypothetical protein